MQLVSKVRAVSWEATPSNFVVGLNSLPGAMGQGLIGELQCRPLRILEQGHAICTGELYTTQETVLGMLLRLRD